MSRASNLFTVGIFIIFLAILFHYFCRTRKKPDLIVQQQITNSMPSEGYVYPITPNVNQQGMGGPNQMYPGMPMPYRVATGGAQYPYPYSLPNTDRGPIVMHNQVPWPTGYTHSTVNQTHSQSGIPNQHPVEDLPPPYHVAVAHAQIAVVGPGAATAPSAPHHP